MVNKTGSRKYTGNPPTYGTLLTTFDYWSLYDTGSVDKAYWNVKLVCIGQTENKANYWISYDLKKNTFCRKRDTRTLHKNNIDLHDAVLNWMSQNKPNG